MTTNIVIMYIELADDFEVIQGAEFEAVIEGCE